MNLKTSSEHGLLVVTATGQISLKETASMFRKSCDAAWERGFTKIMFDFLQLTGELPVLDQYELAKRGAEYCLSKSRIPVVAVIGKPPTLDGFFATVASNRGLTVETFSDRQAAVEWLKSFGANATAS